MKIEISQFPDGLRLNILGGDIFGLERVTYLRHCSPLINMPRTHVRDRRRVGLGLLKSESTAVSIFITLSIN